MADASASKPTKAVPSQPSSKPSTRTLADVFAIAVARGAFRQKHAKALTPADTDARARHDAVTYQIKQLFLRSDAGEKIAAVPVKERYFVFQNELCRLHDELVGRVLGPACYAYAELAITHRSELPDDLLGWVRAQVDADLSGVRGWWEQWVRCVVSLNAVVSLNSDVPAWISYQDLCHALGHLPSDIELSAALPDVANVLGAIWILFRRDLGKAVDVALLDAKGKLVALPTSVQAVSAQVQLMETIREVPAAQDSTPVSPDRARVELGKWGNARLEEFHSFTGLVRGGRPPEGLSSQFPTLFTEVIDQLTPAKRERLYEDAQRRYMTKPELMELIAEVKYLKGSTLADYRKEYRKLHSTDAPKP